VKLGGLVKVPHLNGNTAVLTSFNHRTGKWQLDLDGMEVNVKPENISLVTEITTPKPKITPEKPKITPEHTQLLIDGKWVNSASGKTFESIDPRTEEKVCDFQAGGAEDVSKAIAAARRAFDEGPWPRMSGYERGRKLAKLAELIEKNTDRLAQLETLDNGKPLFWSQNADVPLSAQHFHYFSGWADKVHGDTIPHNTAQGNYFAYSLKEPVGVCGQIIPWNFPLLMAAWKLGPALACGNTIVLKPSEKTPMTALELGQLCLEAGIPEGVVNVVPGFGAEAGEALASSELVDKIAFTGSVGTALRIQQVAGIKPMTTELGGKSPAIVFADANIDDAVEKIHFGLFFNHGQCCCASSRVYVHESVYDEFVEKSIKKANERTVGDPFGQVDQGPQVDKLQFDRIMGYINEGRASGLKLAAGGTKKFDKGYFIEPTIFVDMPDTSKLHNEEIFGPVMGISKFSEESDVLRRANASKFGLAAGIFTGSLDTATRVQRHIRAGTVWINCYNVFDNATPFGGYKESGVGREKGQEALKNYLMTKCVTMPISGDPRWL
jgi:aldehyde dehydrogenase (NAD+)